MENEGDALLETVLKRIGESAKAARNRAEEAKERARVALDRRAGLMEKASATTKPLIDRILASFETSGLAPDLQPRGDKLALDEKNTIEPLWRLEFLHPRDLDRDTGEQRRAAVIAGMLKESLVIVATPNISAEERTYTSHKLFEIHNLEYRTDSIARSLAEALREIGNQP